MASSQVDIASSSPFGCVLRDRNHRDGYNREVNKVKATHHAAFQRNIKNFVMDHINMSMSSDDSTTNENNNNEEQMNNNIVASSCGSSTAKHNLARVRLKRTNHKIYNDDDDNENKEKEKNEPSLASLISPRHSRLLDRWAARQAREMVSTLEDEAELLSMDNNNDNDNGNNMVESAPEIPNLGASSLVQIWEKRLNKSSVSKPNTPVDRTSPNAGASANENVFAMVEEQRGLEGGECSFVGPSILSLSPGNDESFPDWESDKTAQSDQSRWCSSESDRVSVADIIKKLTQSRSPTPSCGDDNDNEGIGSSSVVDSSPCRDFASTELSELKALPQVLCSPKIRGRKAFNDLLMQLEKDRYGELKNLADRRAVSKFTQRGRIQVIKRFGE